MAHSVSSVEASKSFGRIRADYTKVRFTYARGEPLANAGEWHHAARSEEGVRNGRSWPGSGRLSTFQR